MEQSQQNGARPVICKLSFKSCDTNHSKGEHNQTTPLLRDYQSSHTQNGESFEVENDAPKEQLIKKKSVAGWFAGMTIVCCLTSWLVFESRIPLHLIIVAIIVAIPLSMISIQALGETDRAMGSEISNYPPTVSRSLN